MDTSSAYPVGLTDFVESQPNWAESWKTSHFYDGLEIWGRPDDPGYTNKYRMRFVEALDLIKKSVPSGARVLDLAAAQGNFSIALSQSGYQVTWNDLRTELAAYVSLKAQDLNIAYLPGNIFELGLKTRFDAVLATEIIEHVAHPDQFLSKLAELVVPNGIIVITTPNGEYFRNKLPKFSDCVDPSIFESEQFQAQRRRPHLSLPRQRALITCRIKQTLCGRSAGILEPPKRRNAWDKKACRRLAGRNHPRSGEYRPSASRWSRPQD